MSIWCLLAHLWLNWEKTNIKCYPDPQPLSSTAGRLEQQRQHLETSAGGRADRCDGLRSYCTRGHVYDRTSTCSQAFSHHHHQELKFVCCTSLWTPSSSSSSPAGSQLLFLRAAAVGVSLQGSRRRHTAVQHLFWKSCSTTVESASVEMSPSSRSSQAILRSSRLMIFPDLVLGSPGAFWM